MDIYFGDLLKEHVSKSLEGISNDRFLLSNLHRYMVSPNNRKVCCLYGLRRTGKTIMSLQEIRNLGAYEETLLISCGENDTMWDVKEQINAHPSCKYIFIDEITKTHDFINTCSFLADRYAIEGTKIVLLGTDSLGFFLVQNDELYDRVNMIHTTFIPYAEYRHVLGKDIESYIAYGGTLTDGSMYKDKGRLQEYSDTAIVYNLMHSLQRWKNGRNKGYGLLIELDERGELASFINKVIEYHNREFVADIINKVFASHDFGSLADLMTKHDVANPNIINRDEINDRIRIFLGIKENPLHIANEKTVNVITEYLINMDVLFKVPETGEYLFTQPGMRHCQAEAIADALVSSEYFQSFTGVQRNRILRKLKEDISGNLLEDIVFYHILVAIQANPNLHAEKYRNLKGQEFDIVVSDYEKESSVAIEVKLSNAMNDGQLKHLADKEFCEEVEKSTGTSIASKVLLYLGETQETNEMGVTYYNVEEFLCYVKGILQNMLDSEVQLYHSKVEPQLCELKCSTCPKGCIVLGTRHLEKEQQMASEINQDENRSR